MAGLHVEGDGKGRVQGKGEHERRTAVQTLILVGIRTHRMNVSRSEDLDDKVQRAEAQGQKGEEKSSLLRAAR